MEGLYSLFKKPHNYSILKKELEERNTIMTTLDTTTGVKHDQEKPRFELISSYAIEDLAKVLTIGALKYKDRNWEQGIAWTRVLAAILRHTFAYLRGESKDPESGISHMAHVMCNAMFILHYERTHVELDNRPNYEKLR